MKLPRTNARNNSTAELRELLRRNRTGTGTGIYAICSANRFVMEAGMLQALEDESLLLIESTSNQVNQFGGYTGQTPVQFAEFVQQVVSTMGFPKERVLLGGDHLGPHVWRKEAARTAMEKAKELVAAYVRAGFTKIHLDASMPCADDNYRTSLALPDEVVHERAAELCEAAEAAYRELPESATAPVYVIGTEVPVPGGEIGESKAPVVTRAKNVAANLTAAKKAFRGRGLEEAWERVVALVVQPGVEFADTAVFPYDARKARSLARCLGNSWDGVFEAHSTDYQSGKALRQMVLDHFAILKVGPWLTFALREAVIALSALEEEWLDGENSVRLSNLRETLEKAMLEDPSHWKSYYRGSERELRFARRYSFSDRARYYWPQSSVTASLKQLLHNLTEKPAPVTMLSQYLPEQAEAVRTGEVANEPGALVRHKICGVLAKYANACGLRKQES